MIDLGLSSALGAVTGGPPSAAAPSAPADAPAAPQASFGDLLLEAMAPPVVGAPTTAPVNPRVATPTRRSNDDSSESPDVPGDKQPDADEGQELLAYLMMPVPAPPMAASRMPDVDTSAMPTVMSSPNIGVDEHAVDEQSVAMPKAAVSIENASAIQPPVGSREETESSPALIDNITRSGGPSGPPRQGLKTLPYEEESTAGKRVRSGGSSDPPGRPGDIGLLEDGIPADGVAPHAAGEALRKVLQAAADQTPEIDRADARPGENRTSPAESNVSHTMSARTAPDPPVQAAVTVKRESEALPETGLRARALPRSTAPLMAIAAPHVSSSGVPSSPASAVQASSPTSAPVPEESIGPQIVQSMRLIAQDGGGEARVHLKPEYLGEVVILLKVEQGGVTASLHAESPAVRQWAETHEHVLRQSLGAQGLRLEQLTVQDTAEPSTPERQPDGRAADQREQRPPARRPRADAESERFEVVV